MAAHKRQCRIYHLPSLTHGPTITITYAGVLAIGHESRPALILQVSDLHTCQHQHLRKNRERLADLHLFSSALVPNIAPQAILFTGDLTDSKTADGVRQFQYEWEWQAYRNVTAGMKSAAGPCCQVRRLQRS